MKSTLNINGITVEYSLAAGGNPVMIFLNGFRMPFSSWDQVSSQLAQTGTVLQFNRFGVGKTSTVSFAHSGLKSIEILQELLSILDLKPPYIIIAHSLGGLIANLYARLHPETIAGIVFVEATHPDEKAAQAKFKPPVFLRVVSEGLKKVEKLFDKHKYSEDETYAETVAEIEKHPFFPAIPIRVVSGLKKMFFVPEDSFFTHLDCQEKLLHLSPLSQRIFAEESGHFPQITEPELVIETVRELVEKVKRMDAWG